MSRVPHRTFSAPTVTLSKHPSKRLHQQLAGRDDCPGRELAKLTAMSTCRAGLHDWRQEGHRSPECDTIHDFWRHLPQSVAWTDGAEAANLPLHPTRCRLAEHHGSSYGGATAAGRQNPRPLCLAAGCEHSGQEKLLRDAKISGTRTEREVVGHRLTAISSGNTAGLAARRTVRNPSLPIR